MYEKETIQNFPAEPHLFCTHTYLSSRIFFYFIAGRLLSLKKEFQFTWMRYNFIKLGSTCNLEFVNIYVGRDKENRGF